MTSNPIHVLAVDDETDLSTLTKEFLEMPGELEVDTVVSVREAMASMASKHYDAIISDYQMPEEDGIQFLKTLRSNGDKTPFILFTGKGREEVVIEALNNGADAYLQKGGEPVSQYVELGHRIMSLVRQRRSEETHREVENRYRALVENSPLAIFVNRDDQVVMVNQECLRLFGATYPEELIGLPVFKLFHPDCHTLIERRIERLRVHNETVPSNEEKIVRIDGGIVDVEVSAAPFEEQGNNSIHVVLRDISDRKRTENALQESEERFRSLADNTFEGIGINIDGIFIDANQALSNILGYERGELIGMKPLDFLTPESGKQAMEHVNQLFIGSYDAQAVKKNGDIIPVRLRGKEIIWKGKRARLSAVQDITEQKRTEEALRKSEERYRTYITHSSTPFVVVGGNDRFIEVNQATCDMLGFTREELLGMKVDQIVAPEEVKVIRSGSAVLHNEGKATQEMRLQRKDGVLVSVIVEAVNLPDDSNMAFFTDITDLKLVEADLRKKTALFEAQVASSIDGILVIDENFKRIMVNQRIVELYNVPQRIMDIEDDIFLLQHVVSLTKYPEQFLEKVAYLNEHVNETSRDEVEFRNGMVLDRYSAPVLGKDGHYYGRTWTFRDITERKRVEGALMVANRKLNLLSSITRHDINNQTVALRGHLALLKIKHPNLAIDEQIKTIDRAAGQISAMIRFTKEYEDIGVHTPIWKEVRRLVEKGAGDMLLEDVSIINDVPEGTAIFADPLIVKVFHNLIHNAIRHGGHVTTIRFSVEERDGVDAVVCEDDGTGIPKDIKTKIFTKGIGKDNGFGLFLCREILAITDITITEEGEAGKGAKFVMTLPQKGLRKI